MHTVAVVAVAAAAASCAIVAARAELPSNPPAFSWDRVPLFFHAANETWFDAETLKFAASMPLVTIEKFQSSRVPPENKQQEAKIVEQLRRIHEVNASTVLVAYLNTIIAFEQYSLFERVNTTCRDTCFLHNQDGSLFEFSIRHGPPNLIYDLSDAQARSLWLDAAESMLNNSWVDGIFADRGRATAEVDLAKANITEAHRAAWDKGHAEMITEVGDLARKLSGGRGMVIANGADLSGVDGRMIENMRPNDTSAEPAGNDIVILMDDVGKRVVEAHADKVPLGTGANSPLEFNASLAAYLVGAGEHTYFQATESWSTAGGWMTPRVEFGLPLGEPIGLGVKKDFGAAGVAWTREFKSGVRVFLDTANWSHPCILWPTGPDGAGTARLGGSTWGYVTGQEADCQGYLSG